MASKDITVIPNTKLLSGQIDADNNSLSIDMQPMRSTLSSMMPQFKKGYATVLGYGAKNGQYKACHMNLQYSLSAGNGIYLNYGSAGARDTIGINTDNSTVYINGGKLKAAKYTADEDGGIKVLDVENSLDKKLELDGTVMLDVASLNGEQCVDLANKSAEKLNAAKDSMTAEVSGFAQGKIGEFNASLETAKTWLQGRISTINTEIDSLTRQIAAKYDESTAYCRIAANAKVCGRSSAEASAIASANDVLAEQNTLIAKRSTLIAQRTAYNVQLRELKNAKENAEGLAKVANILNSKAAYEAETRSWFSKVIDFTGTPFTRLADAGKSAASYVSGLFTGTGSANDNTTDASDTVQTALNATVSNVNFKVPVKVKDLSSLYFGNDKAADALVLSSDLSIAGTGNSRKVTAVKGIPIAGSGNGITQNISVLTHIGWNPTECQISSTGFELSFKDGILTAATQLTSAVDTIGTVSLTALQS